MFFAADVDVGSFGIFSNFLFVGLLITFKQVVLQTYHNKMFILTNLLYQNQIQESHHQLSLI
jgi:hypothetical protein